MVLFHPRDRRRRSHRLELGFIGEIPASFTSPVIVAAIPAVDALGGVGLWHRCVHPATLQHN